MFPRNAREFENIMIHVCKNLGNNGAVIIPNPMPCVNDANIRHIHSLVSARIVLANTGCPFELHVQ